MLRGVGFDWLDQIEKSLALWLYLGVFNPLWEEKCIILLNKFKSYTYLKCGDHDRFGCFIFELVKRI